MTTNADDTHNPTPADQPLALSSSAVLGPMLERLRDCCEPLLDEAADEIERLAAHIERVALIVAKMRADLTAVGGFDNRFLSQPAVNIREYIADLEAALGAGPNAKLT